MKRKIATLLLIGTVAGASLALAGCGSLTEGINKITEGSADAAEFAINPLATDSQTDASIHLSSRWYNESGEPLSGVTVTVSADGSDLYTGTTDSEGKLPVCSFPSNTIVTFTVQNELGATLGSSRVGYEVSTEYSVITIMTRNGESTMQKIRVPSGKTELTAAMYVDSDGLIGNASITVTRPEEEAGDQAGDDSAGDGSSKDKADKDKTDSDSDSADSDSDESSSDDGASDDGDDSEE